MYLLYIFPPELHTLNDFIVLTSLAHLRKIILVVLQIVKDKDLSAPLRTCNNRIIGRVNFYEVRVLLEESVGPSVYAPIIARLQLSKDIPVAMKNC
jgi:hypothetical protein